MVDDVRHIPGSIEVPGRVFLYLEHADPAQFQQTFDAISEQCEGERMPASGGIITENVILTIPSGASFCGLSFKGDVVRWEAGVASFAKANGCRVLRVRGGQVEVSDGTSWSLAECRTGRYEVRRGRTRGRRTQGPRGRPTRS